SAKDPPSSQDAPSQDTPAQDSPSQDAPVDDTESSEAKAASTSSPAKNLTSTEEPSIAKGFKSLFDSSDEEEEEGAVSEPREISNDLDEQQERYQAAQLQGTPVPSTPAYPRGYYPPDAGSGSPMFLEHLKAPRGLNHGRTARGAYERALVQDKPLFVNDIEAARDLDSSLSPALKMSADLNSFRTVNPESAFRLPRVL
ncbi:ABC Superfamily, partial [Phytophthora palmivora]